MKFLPAPLEGSYIVQPEPLRDERGWFARTYCANEFTQIGHHKEWVQMNHSYTKNKGTVRGMHFQLPPHSEIKLVRCIRGKIFDVIVDIRKDSDTFMQWFGAELSADNMQMLYIPEGFAHGFQTLTDDCELIYHHSDFYTPGAESGIRYDDEMIKIKWPLPVTNISDRDRSHAALSESFKGI